MLSFGIEKLTNQELLAIIISTGNKEDSSMELSNKILSILSNGIEDLNDIALEELTKISGIGNAKGIKILASLELGKRATSVNILNIDRIASPQEVYNLLKTEFHSLKKEIFKVIYLNTKNEIIGKDIISMGSLNSSIVHPREVFKNAIKRSANSVILIHNHPSGNPTPSTEDINITKRLIEAGEIIGIKVIDHVIIGNGKFISFKEEGLF